MGVVKRVLQGLVGLDCGNHFPSSLHLVESQCIKSLWRFGPHTLHSHFTSVVEPSFKLKFDFALSRLSQINSKIHREAHGFSICVCKPGGFS